jgi:ABC-type polar amino acid transport system ATPase subunit
MTLGGILEENTPDKFFNQPKTERAKPFLKDSNGSIIFLS